MMRGFLLTLTVLGFIFAQDRKEQLQIQIREAKEKLAKEKKFLDDYENRREKLNASKKEEVSRLEADLRRTRAETAEMNGKIRQNEILVRNYDLEKAQALAKFKGFALSMKNAILTGMPYDEQRRAAIFTSIISDIDSGVGSASEILNRLVSFFEQDDTLSYDSQSYSAVATIAGKEANVVILRVGRILFFVDDGKNVYPYVNLGKGYVVDEENSLNLSQKQAVRDAILMLNSQKPLDIVSLRMVLGDDLLRRGKNSETPLESKSGSAPKESVKKSPANSRQGAKKVGAKSSEKLENAQGTEVAQGGENQIKEEVMQ